jgi:hypothetical protein
MVGLTGGRNGKLFLHQVCRQRETGSSESCLIHHGAGTKTSEHPCPLRIEGEPSPIRKISARWIPASPSVSGTHPGPLDDTNSGHYCDAG